VAAVYEKNLPTGEVRRLLKRDWADDDRSRYGVLSSSKLSILRATGIWRIADWSRYGVVFYDRGAVFALPMEGDRKPQLLTDFKPRVDEFRVSPDGRWIAYNSDSSGTWEAYIASFRDFTKERRISSAGGVQPQWRRDGKEVFYLSPDGKMMSVEIRPGSELEIGVAKPLFETRLIEVKYGIHQYGVTGDGQRFLLLEPVSGAPEAIRVILNWPSMLGKPASTAP
jgi:hypothetical protein